MQKQKLDCPFQLNKFFNNNLRSSIPVAFSTNNSNDEDKKYISQQEIQLKERLEKKQQEEHTIELVSDSNDILPISYWWKAHEFRCYYCLISHYGTSVPRVVKKTAV